MKDILPRLIGAGLILFALVPTPDDTTIISPLFLFTVGMKLLLEGEIKY